MTRFAIVATRIAARITHRALDTIDRRIFCRFANETDES